MTKGNKKRNRLSQKTGAGTMQHSKLTFPSKYSLNPRMRFHQFIQIIDKLCDQYSGQIPAFAWKPMLVTSQELKKILGTHLVHAADLTQKVNISVIHADRRRTSGKRYTLQIDSDRSNISLLVAGSRKLYDLFIDMNQDRNLLLSYRAEAARCSKKMLVELQLAIMPSNHESDNYYMYSLSYKSIGKKPEKPSLKKAMERQLRHLSLSPEPHAEINSDKNIKKITTDEFEKAFGVKLAQSLSVANDVHNGDNRDNRDLRTIISAYRKLQPFIDGQLDYDVGIKNGSLQDVSQESLLGTILAQMQKRKCLPKVIIVKIDDLVGYGLFAGEYIPVGMIIGEYCGEISRVAAIDKDNNNDNTYFAAYAPDEVPGSEMFVIDAKKRGNPTRFINHSDENSNAAWAHIFDGSRFRLIIAAVKPIPKGKQVLLKYKRSYWSSSHMTNPCPL